MIIIVRKQIIRVVVEGLVTCIVWMVMLFLIGQDLMTILFGIFHFNTKYVFLFPPLLVRYGVDLVIFGTGFVTATVLGMLSWIAYNRFRAIRSTKRELIQPVDINIDKCFGLPAPIAAELRSEKWIEYDGETFYPDRLIQRQK